MGWDGLMAKGWELMRGGFLTAVVLKTPFCPCPLFPGVWTQQDGAPASPFHAAGRVGAAGAYKMFLEVIFGLCCCRLGALG